MTLEEAIAALLAEVPGSQRGATARPAHPFYDAGRGHRYRRCESTYRDRAYGWHEFIAEHTHGRKVVAINLNPGPHYGKVTCGPKGFHTRHQTRRPKGPPCF